MGSTVGRRPGARREGPRTRRRGIGGSAGGAALPRRDRARPAADPAGFIQVRHVIDGQQRLTTLQLLLDAAQEVVASAWRGHRRPDPEGAGAEPPGITQHPDEVFKVWPTDRDQAAFRAAMDNDVVVPPSSRTRGSRRRMRSSSGDHRLGRGRRRIREQATARLNALAGACTSTQARGHRPRARRQRAGHLRDAQPPRGSAAGRGLGEEPACSRSLRRRAATSRPSTRSYWEPLDRDYWRQLIAQGRLYRPRIDVFLNYWLTMKLLREVPPTASSPTSATTSTGSGGDG